MAGVRYLSGCVLASDGQFAVGRIPRVNVPYTRRSLVMYDDEIESDLNREHIMRIGFCVLHHPCGCRAPQPDHTGPAPISHRVATQPESDDDEASDGLVAQH